MAAEINLRELFGVLKKRLWTIILVTALTTLTGYFYNVFFTPVSLYQSSTRLIVGADNNSMSTLKVMIEDPALLTKVSQEINGQRSPGELANEVAAQIIDTSQVVSITATDENPKLAADIANKTASVFKEEAANILGFNKINALSEANINPYPINPPNNRKMIAGFFGGIILSIGLVFFLNSIDDTIQSERELEKILLVPAFGTISKMTKKNMYHRRKNPFLKKDLVELPNIRKSGKAKKGKLNYKSNLSQQNIDLVIKETEQVHRANQ